MPDWFYRTVSQPILFRFSAPHARDIALGFMGRLSRLPLGSFLIDFLGHMRADSRLRRTLLDTTFPTAVGLGPWLDPDGIALKALSRFGVGFIEIGPVTYEGTTAARPFRRLEDQEALWIDDEPGSISLSECNRCLSKAALAVPVLVRVRHEFETVRVVRELNSSSIVLSTDFDQPIEPILTAAGSRKILLSITADQNPDTCGSFIDAALARGVAGFVVDGSVKADPDGRLVGLPAREHALRQVHELRQR